MIKIAVLDNIRVLPEVHDEIRSLAANEVTFSENAAISTEELVARPGDAKAVLINTGTRIDQNYLDVCPSVTYVGLGGTSTANIGIWQGFLRRTAISTALREHDYEHDYANTPSSARASDTDVDCAGERQRSAAARSLARPR